MSVSAATVPGSRAGGLRTAWRALWSHPGLIAATAVFALVWAGLSATAQSTRPPVSAAAATADLRADLTGRMLLAKGGVTRIDALRLDARHDELELYDGARRVATAAVSVTGRVAGVTDLRPPRSAGRTRLLATEPWVLAVLTITFVLMCSVWPLWRLHNLDVLAAAGLTAPLVLFDQLLPRAMMLSAALLLAYLALRCAGRALWPRPGAPAVRPLFDQLTARLEPAARGRLLAFLAVAAGLIVAMVGLSSLHLLDVAYAVMEGATGLVHGVLPYGHIPDVMHGDTYPLGSYLLYAPLAAFWPVHNVWDNADATLAVAVAAALLIALALWRGPAAGQPVRTGADLERRLAGRRAAIAWLCFPGVLATVATGTTDVALGAFVLGAVLLWRRPTACTAVLALGGWFKLAPLTVLPLTLARLRGRAWGRALGAIALVSTPFVFLLLAWGGAHAVAAMVSSISFQQTRMSVYSVWPVLGGPPVQHVAQAGVLAFLAGACVQVRRDRELGGDRTRMAALIAAVLIGLQFGASYWAVYYLTWLGALVAMALCPPLGGSRCRSAR